MAKSGAQTLTFKSVTDRQTDKQTDRQTDKKLNVLAAPVAGEIRAPSTWHSDRDLEQILAPLKLFGSDAWFRRYGR